MPMAYDPEHKRQWAREKWQHDQLSRLHSAREEGFQLGYLMGIIGVRQRRIDSPPTPPEHPHAMSLEEPKQQAFQLEQQTIQLYPHVAPGLVERLTGAVPEDRS